MKQCTECKLFKSESEFFKNKTSRDGLRSNCKACHRESVYVWKRSNLEKSVAIHSEWVEKNPEKVKINAKKWRDSNVDVQRSNIRKWAQINPGKKNAKEAKRRAAKLFATPKWLTSDHLMEIESIYVIAKELSWLSDSGLQVDHIVPLQGENVSGLHVPWNLQILPSVLNSSKGNRF